MTLARHGWLALGAAAIALPGPARAQESVWGTRAGEVMVAVYAQFSEDDDDRLWHEPLRSVTPQGADVLRIELPDGVTVYAPVSGARSAREEAERVRAAEGELLRLEYHPAQDTPRGRVHASWTLSPDHAIAGSGHVPITNRLYSAMLRRLGDDVPDTGVFAPLAAAQRRLDLLVRNVTSSNGREADELAEDFLAAANRAGLPLDFYKLPDGTRASDEVVQGLLHRGYVLSAVDYWNAALSKFRRNRIVGPTLNDFESAWEKVPEGTKVSVEFPGRRAPQPLSADLLRDFRLICGQKYLSAAESAAEGEDPEWTVEMLRRFEEEREASGLPMSEFRIAGRPAQEGDPEFLIKRARRENGFVGFFRAIWHRILAASMPNATPT
jgi:hypothetical protein